MNIDNGKKTIADVKNENNFFKKILLVMALVNLFLLAVLSYALLRQTVVVVPPVVTNKYEISADGASPTYLVDMAEYVITMLRTINPQNVEHNNSVILKMVSADTQPKFRKILDAQAARIKKEDIITVWSGATVPPKVVGKNSVVLNGTLKTYYSDKLVSTDPKEYKVTFDINSFGRLYVAQVEEIKPSVAPISNQSVEQQ